jgi:hypothetical protein
MAVGQARMIKYKQAADAWMADSDCISTGPPLCDVSGTGMGNSWPLYAGGAVGQPTE